MADGGKFGFEIAIDDKATPTLKATTAQMQSLEKTGVATGAKVGTSFATMAKSFVAAAGGVLVLSKAWGALTSLGRTALKNAAEQVEANAQLEFQYGANAAALIKQASALQIVTKFGDDQIQNAQFALGTFKLTADAVEKLTPAILDLAQAKKMDATAAADLLGKAMVGNIGLLGRYGIVLTETQKHLLQTGTEEQKVAILTQELGSRFAGVAEEMNTTVPGAVASLKKAWGEVLESQGMMVESSEKIRVGVQSIANQMFAMGGNAEAASLQTDRFAMSLIDTAIVAAESTRGIIGFGKAALNIVQIMQLATPAGIIAAGGNLKVLTQEIGENIRDLQAGMDPAYLKSFVDVLRNARQEMMNASGKTPMAPRLGGGGRLGGDTTGRAGAAEASKNEPWSEEVLNWTKAAQEKEKIEREWVEYKADVNLGWTGTLIAREDAAREEQRQRELDRAKAGGELLGGMMAQGIQSATTGLADTIVDGAADWDSLGKNFLKSTIATTAQLVIQLALWKAIQASATATAVASAAASGGTTTAGGFFAMGLGSALGAGGGLFHQGGAVGRYHTGGPIMRAHSGMRLGSHEVPIVAERGEFVMRRSAVNRIGSDTLDRMNRGERVGGGVNITINAAPGQSEGAIADAVMDRLIRESRRGRAVINARGLEQ